MRQFDCSCVTETLSFRNLERHDNCPGVDSRSKTSPSLLVKWRVGIRRFTASRKARMLLNLFREMSNTSTSVTLTTCFSKVSFSLFFLLLWDKNGVSSLKLISCGTNIILILTRLLLGIAIFYHQKKEETYNIKNDKTLNWVYNSKFFEQIKTK